MGRFLKQYEKENMRTAMLRQEETFTHQVHELHRLYRVQKVLVNDMKEAIKKQRRSSDSRTRIERWNTDNETTTSQQPCYSTCQDDQYQTGFGRTLNLDQYIGKDGRDDVDEHSDLELTLATGSKSTRKKEKYSFASDSRVMRSFSSSSSSSSSESGATRMSLNGNGCRGLLQVPDVDRGSYQKERKRAFDVEEQTREERVKQPPWLFHCPSLNMT